MVRTLVHCCAMFVSALGASMALADTLTPTTDISAATYSTVDWNSKSIRIYKDLAYGTRADQADEGANYVNKAGGKNSYHTHRSGQQYDLYLPASPISDAPVYLDVHGGSWSECFDKDGSEVELMKSLAARGFVAIGMDYQLQSDIMSKGETTARENATYADMLRDIDAMLQYLKDNEILQSLGASTNKIIIGGTSAGAHLSMMYAWDQAATNHSVALNHPLPIRAVVPVQGPSDFTDPSMMVMAAYFPYLENDAYVAASPELQQMKAYVTLMGWLSNTTLTQENFATEMAKWSPALLINENSCPAILAYSTTNTVDDATAHQSSDGMIPVPLYDSLTNKLTAAGVDYRASLFTGISHGYLAWSENLESNAGYQWLVTEIANYATNFVESAGGGTGGESGGESGGEKEEPPTGSFAKKVTLTLSADLATTEITTGLPTLVRLSESAIAGFLYSDFQLANGGDLKFTDDAGIEIPHEVDTWNPSGESLVWVRLPSTAAGTAVTMYWGGGEKGALASSAVWSDYIGVWHLGDPVGTSANSSPNGTALDGVDTTRTVANGSVAGRFGKAKVVSDHLNESGAASNNFGGIYVPSSDKLSIAGSFTISGWFKHATGRFVWDHLFYKREKSDNTGDHKDAFGIEMAQGGNSTTRQISVRGSSSKSGDQTCSGDLTQWSYLSFVYNGGSCTIYQNGAMVGKGAVTVDTVKANEEPLVFGNNVNIASGKEGDAAWYGSIDEVRLVGTAMSASQLDAEYKAMSAAFASGVAEELDDTAIKFGAPSVSIGATVTVTVPVLDGKGSVSVVCNGTETHSLGTVDGAATLNQTLAIPEGAVWKVDVVGVSEGGTETSPASAITVLNGTVNAEKVFDTDEQSLSNALFRVVRPSSASATAYPLTVNLTWGGTGVAGTSYEDNLPSVVTIPAGESSVDLPVTPLLDPSGDDRTVELSVAAGFYVPGTSAVATIANLDFPEGVIVWVAREPGKASDASNWNLGRVPAEMDSVLFDGRFSTADCEWDGGVNGLSGTVAAWKQASNFSGTVTVGTMYPEVANATFTLLAVAGDMEVSGGKVTQCANGIQEEIYRLNLRVGGNLTVASGASIDVSALGPRGVMSGRSENAYGGDAGVFGSAYGDPKRPYYCGSGNNGNWPNYYKSGGGGAAWIEVDGAAVVNGSLLANGGRFKSSETGPVASDANIGTSGGSIYLKADALTGSGTISASALVSGDNKAASGGRIAIECTGTATEFPLDNIKAWADVGIAGHRGNGTVVIRNPGEENGTLIVRGNPSPSFSYNSTDSDVSNMTTIPSDGTWSFDRVVVGDMGRLVVRTGTTLNLPGGFASVSCSNKVTNAQMKFANGILVRGGTLNAPAIASKHTIGSGNWTFYPSRNYVFDEAEEVVVKDGANLGAFAHTSGSNNYDVCSFTINGNLTVESTGRMQVGNAGVGGAAYAADTAPFAPFLASKEWGTGHGGQNGMAGARNNVYGSFFNPVLPGTPAGYHDYRSTGAGALVATVTGRLTLDGSVSADSTWAVGRTGWKSRASGAGSINLTVGSLSGNGSISASGAAGQTSNSDHGYGASGGGRVAIRLTANGATFADFDLGKILAKGYSHLANLANPTNSSSAGSIYLQTAAQAEKGGVIVIKNDGVAGNLAWTPVPAVGYNLAAADDLADFKNTGLSLEDAGKVRFFENMSVRELVVQSGSTLDLNGRDIIVKRARLGGKLLGSGRYVASDLAVSDYVVDTADTAGSLMVIGSGFSVRLR